MAEVTPAIEQPTEPTLTSLPAKGRPITTRQKVALGIAGLATAVTAAGCDIFPFLTSKATPNSSPSATVEQSSSPVPTPISSENPTIVIPSKSPTKSPSATPSAAPTETAKPTSTATKTPEVTAIPDTALGKALKQWLSEKGNTGIPTGKEWTQFGKKQGLSLSTGSRESVNDSNYTPEYSTLDKGTVVIPDANGVPHLALPILQVDGAGNHYYLFLNLGPLNATELNGVGLIPDRNNIGIVPEQHNITITQLQTVLNKLKGDIFLIGFFFGDSSPDQSLTIQEYMSAKPIDRALAAFTLKASQPGVSYKSLLAEFPDIAKLINAYPTEIDATAMPFPSYFETASLPK
ncbi:MAG TPA: hypothetical protein VMR77_00450 [Patescibacteria group bacterium]|nr:hypothetical protein [Patescibacteria group bacterium]